VELVDTRAKTRNQSLSCARIVRKVCNEQGGKGIGGRVVTEVLGMANGGLGGECDCGCDAGVQMRKREKIVGLCSVLSFTDDAWLGGGPGHESTEEVWNLFSLTLYIAS
jgi:hypothetical protein